WRPGDYELPRVFFLDAAVQQSFYRAEYFKRREPRPGRGYRSCRGVADDSAGLSFTFGFHENTRLSILRVEIPGPILGRGNRERHFHRFVYADLALLLHPDDDWGSGAFAGRVLRVRAARQAPSNQEFAERCANSALVFGIRTFQSLRTVGPGRDPRHCNQSPQRWHNARTLSIQGRRLGVQPHLDQHFYGGRFLHFRDCAGLLSISLQGGQRREGFRDCQQTKLEEPGNTLRWERDGLSDGRLRANHVARNASGARRKIDVRVVLSERGIFGRHGVWAGFTWGFFVFQNAS